MAFTTSFGAILVGASHRINTTASGNQWNPQAVVTGAGAALFYADQSVAGGRILARLTDAAGVGAGAEIVVAAGVDADRQRGYSVAELGNGNIVVAWTDASATPVLRFKVLSPTLATVIDATTAAISGASARHPDVAATANGGFVIAWEKDFGAGDSDIAFRRFDSSGASSDALSGVVVQSTGANRYPSVAVLADGKIALAFQQDSGATNAVWHALYNANGAVNVAAMQFDATGSRNQLAEVAARADGGYLVSYEDSGWTGADTDITVARFTAAGAFQNYVRGAEVAQNNVMASIALSPDGYALVTNTSIGFNDMLGALLTPTGSRVMVDERLVGDGAGAQLSGYGSAQWLDASHVLVTTIGDNGAPGDDGLGYGVATTIREVRRTVTGDGAADIITLDADGIVNVVNAGAGADRVTTGVAADVIDGGTGNDEIDAGAGDDAVHGGADNDTIIGGAGDDMLYGDAGLDTIYGGEGNDFILDDSGASSVLAGEAGDDQIYGGAGADYMIGGAGNDVMVGMGGQDSLYGGDGDDYIVAGNGVGSVVDGGAGANILWGASGNDYMVGGDGADLIVGGAGSDYLFGNAGADTLYGGRGTDYIYTNAGNDFVWTDDVGAPQSTDYVYVGGGTGVDTIADFTAGSGSTHDVLVVSPASGVTNFAQAQAHMTQVGVYTVLTLGSDQVYLYNVQPFQLTAADFLFI